MSSPEILIVANRLPVSWTHPPGGERKLTASPGGLVSALAPVATKLECTWLGWLNESSGAEFIVDGTRLITVVPDTELFEQYYHGFANQVLWPIFHGLPKYVGSSVDGADESRWWESYQRVNQIFANRVAETAGEGAVVWVHDYHLLLVPLMLREKRPDLKVVVFLHIPFPKLETFEKKRWARELLEGVCAASLIGVQRDVDAENLGVAQRALAPGCSPTIRVFPISIDVAPYEDVARTELGAGAPEKFRYEHGLEKRKMLLSVDRLDYTKGILERIEAFEGVLAQWDPDSPPPTLVQVLTPTREDIPTYLEYARRVREATARVCERYGSSGYSPILTLSDLHTVHDLVRLYLATDVMVVTPLRDGMNLVSKEFAVSRIDGLGVLVLGREAGSADELHEAVLVDPLNSNAFVAALLRALTLPPEEVTDRVRALGARVQSRDVYAWADAFLIAALAPL